MKKNIITYVVSIILATGIILTVCGVSGVLTTEMEEKEIVRYTCDGFFVSAALMLCFGVLVWASKLGAFDGFGYSFVMLKHKLTNTKRDFKTETYTEYKERVAEKRKVNEVNHFMIIGGVLILVATILFLVYSFAL